MYVFQQVSLVRLTDQADVAGLVKSVGKNVTNVELVAPTAKGGKSADKMDLSSFTFDADGRITGCAAGHSPLKVSYKKKAKRFSARFDLNQCTGCPHIDQCPAVPGKNNYFVRYSDKDRWLAVRRRLEASNQFVDIYRWRAGVEATMSQYDRLTGVKRLRVRGLKAVRYCATLKAAGLNMLRPAAVAMARKRAKELAKGRLSAHFMPYPFVKERIDRFYCGITKLLLPNITGADGYLRSAA